MDSQNDAFIIAMNIFASNLQRNMMLNGVVDLIRQYIGCKITLDYCFQQIFLLNSTTQFRESLFSVFLLGGLSKEYLLNNSDKNYLQSKKPKKNVIKVEPERKKGAWYSKENWMLTKILNGKKTTCWSEVAQALNEKSIGPEKSSQQCHQHWNRVANPSIKKGPWTVEDEEKLLNLHAFHNNSWSKIAKEIPGRADMQCKHHYEMLKASLSQNWTSQEEESLLSATRIFSDYIDWEYVSNNCRANSNSKKNRYPVVCKLRYQEILQGLLVSSEPSILSVT
jgi:hypothetical protein